MQKPTEADYNIDIEEALRVAEKNIHLARGHARIRGLQAISAYKRLIELEGAVLKLANSDENLTDAINDIVYLAERIKAGREAQ